MDFLQNFPNHQTSLEERSEEAEDTQSEFQEDSKAEKDTETQELVRKDIFQTSEDAWRRSLFLHHDDVEKIAEGVKELVYQKRPLSVGRSIGQVNLHEARTGTAGQERVGLPSKHYGMIVTGK